MAFVQINLKHLIFLIVSEIYQNKINFMDFKKPCPIVIDGRYTLFHKHFTLPEFIFECFRLAYPKQDFQLSGKAVDFIKSSIKTTKIPEILDFINIELLQNDDFAKILPINDKITIISEAVLAEALKKTVLKIKILEDFTKTNASAIFFIPISNALKQNYYKSLILTYYPFLLPVIKFIPKSEINPQTFQLQPDIDSKVLLITHKPSVFDKFPKDYLRIYYHNKFYNPISKEKIEKTMKNIAFEIDLLNFLPSAFEFSEKRARESTKIIRIGYLLFAKKIEDVFTKNMFLCCFPFEFIPMDMRYPIENQNFDIVIHKITDVIKYFGFGAEREKYEKNFKDFYEKYRETIVFIDGLEGINIVNSRVLFQEFFEKVFGSDDFKKKIALLPYKTQVKVPKIIEINGKTALEPILDKMKHFGLNFPVIVKTKQALGEMKSHFMAVALDSEGLKVIEENEIFKNEEHIVQELINHDETIFKIYVIGEKSFFYTRQSLPNMTIDVLGKPFFFFDSQIPFKDQMEFLKKRDIDFKEKHVKIEESLFDLMTECISEKLGFSLYGYDLIKDCRNGDVHIVDINYFPGFKFDGNLQKYFLEFFLKKLKK